ncbi:FHA domain-containing protein [Microbacterium cremeum]|uniref:FHA domain-containing protein n=1 Tax=Microbacterium cremeum TaxID=2782169 RepID=UPI0018885F7B|nr:FHA domain-containing protein [Microbacterium cremeum]
MPTLYSPGASLVAATPHGVVVLEPGSPVAVAARVRGLLAEGRGLGGVIETLTGAYGASLTAMPSFAVALAEGDRVRVAVRGAFVLQVGSDHPETISGEGVTTWSERVLDHAGRVTVSSRSAAATDTSTASAAVPSGSPELPVADGVVLASVVAWEPEGAAPAAGGTAAPATPEARPAPLGAEPEPGPAPLGAEPEPAPAPEPEPEPEPEPALTPAPRPALGAEPEPRAALAAEPEPDPRPEPAPAPASARSGMIDSSSVPSVAHLDTLLPDESTLIPSDDEPAEAPGSAGQDDPLLTTVIRGRELPADPPLMGDHDGATVSLAQARALRGSEAPTSSVPPLAPPRPRSPGRLRVSNGQVVALDRTVVIGRRPRSTRVSGTDLPHLVAVDSPQQDISRSHVEVRVEGDSIVATDLRTTNGTTLRRAGSDPVRLHPGEGTVVVPGDVLDLGDGITVAVEEMP